MSGRVAPGGRLLLVAAGFVLWSAAFVVIYAMLSVGCAYGWDGAGGWLSPQRVQLVVLFALFLAGGGWLALTLRRAVSATTATASPTERFLRRLAWGTAAAAVASTAFTFAGVLALSPCT